MSIRWCFQILFFFNLGLLLFMGCQSKMKNTLDLNCSSDSAEVVLLLHGMCRSSYSMKSLQNTLESAGYQVMNINYPSTQYPIEQLISYSIVSALEKLSSQKITKIHFVTHSLGGILLRYYLAQTRIPKLGRVVMLGPPNHGSEVIDHIGHWFFVRWLNGPAGEQLGTDENSIPQKLGPVDFPVGVIAGTRSWNWINSLFFLPGRDDGKVSVEKTKVTGMHDFIELPYTHTFMMNKNEVKMQVLYFIKNGKFFKEDAE